MSDLPGRYESAVEEQIRLAQERGEFDDLPGAGKPLPNRGEATDELWWVKQLIEREGLSTDPLLPRSLQLRKEIERLPDTVRLLPTERMVRNAVAELNLRIANWMRAPSGPQVPIRPVRADDVVARWRADRQAAGPPAVGVSPAASPRDRRRWWRRRAP